MRERWLVWGVFCVMALPLCPAAGTESVGTPSVGTPIARGANRLRVDYVQYRPARWDTAHVTESESEFPNQGGLLYFYLTNVSDKPVDLRFWQYNGHDESYWLLSHLIAWHRTYDGRLDPGKMTALEINATSKDFAPDTPFTFKVVDSTWSPCLRYQGVLKEDPVRITYIRILPNVQDIEIHLRNSAPEALTFSDVAVVGKQVTDTQWRGQHLEAAGDAIARVKVSEQIASSQLLIVKVTVKTAANGASAGERTVYAHRRAFADFFPIGTWGMEPEIQDFLYRDHVDTGVVGGKRDDAFFGGAAARFGFHAMVHTGEPVNVDMVRDLSGHPAAACWMLRDEPDWSLDPQVMLFCDMTVRAYDKTIPTFINLCRNTKFMEYAAIPDIAGHDHYCVSAPSSSKWPHPYGTYLEETAYYTKDLKYAAEPRPIWVWSQGNHNDWEERPKRPLPTPQELTAQLVLNLGQGAKGILWFTYNNKMSDKYPETRQAMRGWNRVMAVLREDFLAGEPAALAVEHPDKVDVAPLVCWDKLILCVTNLDYEMQPEGYPFKTRRDVKIVIDLPDWIQPGKPAIRVAGEGVSEAVCKIEGNKAFVTLDTLVDGAIVVLANEDNVQAEYDQKYKALLADEHREFK